MSNPSIRRNTVAVSARPGRQELMRRLISNSYTRLVNLVTGNRLHYYHGLAVHLRHNVMRWHPNTRGFGFQAGVLCLLKEIRVTTVEQRRGKSNALTFRNFLSVTHTLIEIANRRVSNRRYRPR